MTLLESVVYIDPAGLQWTARKGYKTDGASIPRAFWTLVGGPFEGNYRNAALIHDQYCSDSDHGFRTWRQVHRMFYFAMRASGVGEFEAKTLYAGVLAGGPKWTTPCASCASISGPERDPNGRVLIPRPIETQNAKAIDTWIRSESPSLDEIEVYMDTHFAGVPAVQDPKR